MAGVSSNYVLAMVTIYCSSEMGRFQVLMDTMP